MDFTGRFEGDKDELFSANARSEKIINLCDIHVYIVMVKMPLHCYHEIIVLVLQTSFSKFCFIG